MDKKVLAEVARRVEKALEREEIKLKFVPHGDDAFMTKRMSDALK